MSEKWLTAAVIKTTGCRHEEIKVEYRFWEEERDVMLTTLAVDPGKKAGWCAMHDSMVMHSGSCSGDNLLTVRDVLTEQDPDMVVLEDQHHGVLKGGTWMSMKSFKTLLWRRHVWEILALGYGMDVELVNPRTWQSYFKLQRGEDTTHEWKTRIAKMASHYVGGRPVNHDEGDAILIGQCWYAQRGL